MNGSPEAQAAAIEASADQLDAQAERGDGDGGQCRLRMLAAARDMRRFVERMRADFTLLAGHDGRHAASVRHVITAVEAAMARTATAADLASTL